MTNLKKLAIQITKRYAEHALDMQEVADEFSAKYTKIKITRNYVSKCIYFCIFWDLISKEVIEKCIKKIANNKLRHVNYKNLKPEWLYQRYNRTLADKEERKNLFEYLVILENNLENYRKLRDELHFVRSLNLDNYISSDDERNYIPPRNEECILKDIESFCAYINEKNLSYDELYAEYIATERKIKMIEGRYNI